MPKDTQSAPESALNIEKNNFFNPLPEPSAKAVRLQLNREHKVKAEKRAQKARNRREASARGGLDTNRNKRGADNHPLDRLKSNREQNRDTSKALRQRAYDVDDKVYKASTKINCCSLFGAFRVLSPTVANKIGQALCKSRLCPTCQRVLARKRQAQLIKFFDANAELMREYFICHFVITLRHSRDEDIRDNLYVSELVEKFKELRGATGGTAGVQRKWWDARVAGGMYSVELTPGTDGSPHIHAHVLLLGRMPLHAQGRASAFITKARLDWLKLTEDSSNLYIEPVYTYARHENGEPVFDAKGKKVKEYAEKHTSTIEHLRGAFVECSKYTLKSDPASLSQFTDGFIYDLVGSRNRYFGRFGCLHARDARSAKFKQLDCLNTNFKELEDVDAKLIGQLYNPETRETVSIVNTKLAVTAFSNAKARTAGPRTERRTPGEPARGGEYYYTLLHQDKVRELPFDATKKLPKALAATIYEKYEVENDI